MKFYRKTNKKSAKKKLRDEIGAIHFKILKLKRGERDELDGRPANGLGRFHILPVGEHPRLEFCDENILLVNWLPLHFWWHHYGPESKKTRWIVKRIKELRGDNYREKILEREQYIGKMNELYLMCLKETMQKELNSLMGVI